MSCGFSAASAFQPRFQRSSAPGRKFSIMICARRARRRTISWPSGRRRSQVTDFLLRDCTCHQSDVPFRRRRHLRSASPSPGGSSLITSAPKSPSVFAQNGPAMSEPSSSTRIPVSGPVTKITYLVRNLFALEQAQRVVFEHALAALVDHAVGEAREAAIAPAREAQLRHLAFDVDRVADERRRLHVERRVEEGEPGVLHGRQQQAFGEGVDQRRRHGAALDCAAGLVGHSEELLGEPAQVDEGGEIRFGDGAPVGAEAKADAQVLIAEAPADERNRLAHCLSRFASKLLRTRSKASCMLFIASSMPRIICCQASADAPCRRRSSAIAASRRTRYWSSCFSYCARIAALAARAFDSQSLACAFHWSIWDLSFWMYSSRLGMASSTKDMAF